MRLCFLKNWQTHFSQTWFLNHPAYPQSHMAARYTTIALCPEDNVHCCAENLTTQYPPNTFTLLIITQHASLSSTESPSLCPSTPAPLLTCMLVVLLQTATVWSSFLALNLSGPFLAEVPKMMSPRGRERWPQLNLARADVASALPPFQAASHFSFMSTWF